MNRLRMMLPVFRPMMLSVRNCEGAAAADSKQTKMVRPSQMQKYYLLWSKTYAKPEQIPAEVSYTQLKRATDWARIRINIAMCVVTALACCVVIAAGKNAHKRGQSLQKDNLEWHARINSDDKHTK